MPPEAACALYLAIENDVLASTQNRLATNFVPRCLKAKQKSRVKNRDFWTTVSIMKAPIAEKLLQMKGNLKRNEA